MPVALPPAAAAVLDFWFLSAPMGGQDEPRADWFRKDAAFDEHIRQQFGTLVDTALAGQLPDWGDSAAAGLARILVLDQFPRNLFRDSPRAFAGDAAALALAEALLTSGRDRELPPLRRWFAFMPFMHSESLAQQERAVALFDALRREDPLPAFASAYDYALRHRDIVARFGRFPHRNAVLGRPSTPDEEAFLGQPGSSF